MIFHLALEINVLRCAAHSRGFRIAFQISKKRVSSLIVIPVVGRKGKHMCRLRYGECSLRVALQRHPRITKQSDLFHGS